MKTTLFVLALLVPAYAFAQTTASLPSAPTPRPSTDPFILAQAGAGSASPLPGTAQTPAMPQVGSGTPLSLKQAEALAIQNNPQISVARLNSLASRQVTREVRSNLWPTATVDLTAVDANPGTRISAGALNNPVIYQRAGVGTMVSQLITDFGHTTNLVASANLSAKAEEQNAIATKEQILLAVDQAFYSALQAHALLTVAQQTVNARQTVADQIQALFNSKLKSQLDLSFANVNLAEAKLLFLDAQNNESASLATLSMVLGYPGAQNFQLVEDTTSIAPPPGNVDDLISQAFSMRPEIMSLNFQYESAHKFQTAERDLLLPSIRALGAVGDTPVRNPLVSSWYGAVGVNVDIPVFNGFLYTARAREAALREQVTQERLIDLRNRIARDVRTSWLNANTAYQRVDVTTQLLNQANLALDLAQTRYKLGLGSIVELSQAQLQQTQAQISGAQASYDYRLTLAVLTYETTGI
ncbi:MAG: outer rane efflux protein [Acidobacteriaceae bacterium]|jgi:outer membrane protein|nr:outer rane efflux protein [Acidobacteriaceae bacterium]